MCRDNAILSALLVNSVFRFRYISRTHDINHLIYFKRQIQLID